MHIAFPPFVQLVLGSGLLLLVSNLDTVWAFLTVDRMWGATTVVTVAASVILLMRYHFQMELFEWLWQKIPELPFMRHSDVLMAKAVADIHSLNAGTRKSFVRLSECLPIHPIDRGPALEKAVQRATVAKRHEKQFLQHQHHLSEEFLSAFEGWRSINGIQIVRAANKKNVYTFEGNGRVAALKMAFPGIDFTLEVLEYDFEPEHHMHVLDVVEFTRKRKFF